ncbi:MAG TPA: hypothetical protein VMY42_09540 [Thermoguttaceae bacterium]|nr:hypothetical protein [Thermoguttaceae bacterium]
MSIVDRAKKALAEAAKKLAAQPVLRRYFKEIRGDARPEKLAEMVTQLQSLGIPLTQDWVELHKLAWHEYTQLSEHIKRLPEVGREQNELAQAIEQEQWTGTLAEQEKRRTELGERAQGLLCEFATLTSEASYRDGLPHVFPRLFQVADSPGWACGIWAPIHNFLVERLGIDPFERDPDGRLRTFDVPPQPEDDTDFFEQ